MKGFNVFVIDFSWLSSERNFYENAGRRCCCCKTAEQCAAAAWTCNFCRRKLLMKTIQVSSLLLWTWFIILYSKPMEGWWHEELSFFKPETWQLCEIVIVLQTDRSCVAFESKAHFVSFWSGVAEWTDLQHTVQEEEEEQPSVVVFT